MEMRMLNIKEINIREAENGNPIIEGYFAKFNEFYEICPGWKEKISPGAFDEYLASNNEIKVLWNHDSNIVLGSRSNGTAIFCSDRVGLYGTVELNKEDSDAMNALARIKRKDVTGCSFGFDIKSKERTYEDDGTVIDDIKIVLPIYEVSPCTFPAYEGTEIYARSKETLKQINIEKRKTFSVWKKTILNKIKRS